jgi:hypothetical protein
MKNEKETFYLGLTMAGAVSAGCYSGGVMDYLFEALDLWERAKTGKLEDFPDELIPRHNVVLEAMGGSSAGGMTTMMSYLYAIEGSIKPVKDVPGNVREPQNLLYDCWVLLDDDEKEKTFAKIWDTSDLDDNPRSLKSLFNTTVVENIARRAFTVGSGRTLRHQVENLPSYVSKDLEILISHTFLRGLPLEVDFSTGLPHEGRNKPMHTSFEHFMVSHFRLNNAEPVSPDRYLDLDPYSEASAKRMMLSTIATGAFPLGLKYREFDRQQLTSEYLRAAAKRTLFGNFGIKDPDPENKVRIDGIPSDFLTVVIDGGAVNNEPYGEVASILRKRRGSHPSDHPGYGVIMIDPFPDRKEDPADYKHPEDLVGVVPRILKALWNQSKVKRQETIDHLSHTYIKGEIFPKKHYADGGRYAGSEKYPIACASFEAFGGFLDIDFRVHDFFLGRNNARNFLRYYFSLPYDRENGIVHPIHENWSRESVERYRISKNGKTYLPIIPDLNIVLDNLEYSGDDRFRYTVEKRPEFDPGKLFALEHKITERFVRILTLLKKRSATPPVPLSGEHERNGMLAEKWLRKRYFKGPLRKLGAAFLKAGISLTFALTKKALARRISQQLISLIVKDLAQKRLLKKI